MRREVRLGPAATGRLDRALADALGVGRAAVKRAFLEGGVLIDGRRARRSDPARAGALVVIDLEQAAGPPEPDPGLGLAVLAESARWLVADKPAGLATHPLRAGERATLASAVAARYPECAAASLAPREGGAVHRLDAETSGCVLFARDRAAWRALRAQFAARAVDKGYRALVLGRLAAAGSCAVPLAQRGARVVPVPDERAAARLASKGARPRPAETHYWIEREFARHTLVGVRIATGVMHQVRAHLAFLGHPVAGDALYGGAEAEAAGPARQFLHAARLGFERPEGGRAEVESPLPPELAAFLETLG